MEERLQMHVEDLDVSLWERGEPPNHQRRRSQLLEKAARSHTCNACLKPLPGAVRCPKGLVPRRKEGREQRKAKRKRGRRRGGVPASKTRREQRQERINYD